MLRVNGLEIMDNSNDKRFPYIVKNKSESESQTDLLVFELDQLDKGSPEFVDCETMINLAFSGLEAYWKPNTIVNLLEFVKKNNKPAESSTTTADANQKFETQLNKVINENRKIKPSFWKKDNVTVMQTKKLEQADVKQHRHKGCLDKTDYLVKVKIKLAYLEAYFIHPENNTYPVFLVKLGSTVVEFNSKCDHDEIELLIQNLEAFDCTNYAEGTLDPREQYGENDPIPCKRIIGLNTARQQENQYMLKSTIYCYQFHNELRCQKQLLLLD